MPQGFALAAGVLVALFTVAIGLAALTLLVFQLALMLRGETTWEHLRREQLNSSLNLPPQLRPFDRGAAFNALAFCGCAFSGCLATPPVSADQAIETQRVITDRTSTAAPQRTTYCLPVKQPADGRAAARPLQAVSPAHEDEPGTTGVAPDAEVQPQVRRLSAAAPDKG